MVIPAGTKDPCHSDDCWAGTFSPGWYYEPGLKDPLVPAAKNTEANAKLGHRSKVYSLVVGAGSAPVGHPESPPVVHELATNGVLSGL